jgi:hypothetical protein
MESRSCPTLHSPQSPHHLDTSPRYTQKPLSSPKWTALGLSRGLGSVSNSSYSIDITSLGGTLPPQRVYATPILTVYQFSNFCTQTLRRPPLTRRTASALICIFCCLHSSCFSTKDFLCKATFFPPHHMSSPSKSTKSNIFHIIFTIFQTLCSSSNKHFQVPGQIFSVELSCQRI